MTQEQTVSSIIRDMKMVAIVTDENCNIIQRFIEEAWVSGWEYYKIYEMHRQGNVKPIEEFGRQDEKLGYFFSIAEAERITKTPRKTIQSNLSGSVKRMRNGHYFRYVDK